MRARVYGARDHDAELEPSAEGAHVDREPDCVQESPERPRHREEWKPEQGRAGPEDVRGAARRGTDRVPRAGSESISVLIQGYFGIRYWFAKSRSPS